MPCSIAHVPVVVRLLMYEYSSELIVHYTPRLWIDKSVSSGRWLVAAKLGDLEALKVLEEYTHSLSPQQRLEEEIKWKTPYLTRILAWGGHIRGLKWAMSHNCPMDSLTFAAAVEGGNMQILEYLKQQACPLDASSCTAAARTGQLKILKWLREEQVVPCPWDYFTFTVAVQNGDLQTLLYLRDNRCPWDRGTRDAAAQAGRLDILQWFQEESSVSLELDILKWLFQEEDKEEEESVSLNHKCQCGCCATRPRTDTLVHDAAIEQGHAQMLKSLEHLLDS